jgi:hypothetical protein
VSEHDSLQVQLPNETEAAHILMMAATGASSMSAIPPEVFDVVKLCGRLVRMDLASASLPWTLHQPLTANPHRSPWRSRWRAG